MRIFTKLSMFVFLFGMITVFVADAQSPIKNDEQPTRVNYKRLTTDPNSEFYNKNIKRVKDNVVERYNFNFSRLKDPATGKIPNNIRALELEYVLSPSSRLQKSDEELKRMQSDVNIQTANGDIISAWVNRGPYNVGGRTRALAIDLNDENIILAGGVSGGMWRSTDQGTTWTRVSTADQHPTVTDVEQDPRLGFRDTWYYSSGERIGASQSARNGAAFLQGNGVYKSTDNGLSWSVLSATANSTPQSFDNAFDLIFNVEVNPVNGDLYVATSQGIYRSTDGGTSFTEVLPAEFDNFSDIHITSSGVIYAALDSDGGNGTNGGVYRTTDGAIGTWTNITATDFPAAYGRTVLYTAPSNEDILYVLAANTSTAPVGHDFWKYTYISGDGTDTGGSWDDRSANLPNIGGPVGSYNSQGGYDMYVRVHPTDPNRVFIGGTNIYRSDDGFATASGEWVAGYSTNNDVSLYTNHHPDQHSFEFFPSDPDKVITGHDGGISITNNILGDNGTIEPVDWIWMNNGYLTTQVYALSIGPGDQLMAGFQDNSTWFTNNTNPTDSWVDVFSGDGSYNAFNNDGTVRYVSSQRGNVYRVTYSDANTAVATSFQSISPATGLFVAPFELDPNNDQIMYYAAANYLWRNDDLTNATASIGWTQLTNAAAINNVSIMGISTEPANIVYFGTTSGEIYRIDNANTGNPTAVDIYSSADLPSANVSSIDVNPYNADDVVVTFSNYNVKSIFQTLDGGSTWSNISGNLEENADGTGNGPSVRWATRVGNSDRYFVGTSTGLYSTTTLDGTSTVWTQENLGGINNAIVEQIRVRNSDGLVVAGTHGNGLYSATFEVSEPDVILQNPIADIVLDANSADEIIDISTVFASNTDPIQSITVSVDSNDNTDLLSASISGDDLTLSLLADQFGDALITLKGTDENGEFAYSSFTVTVIPPPITSFPYTYDFETTLPAGWNTSGTMSWVFGNGETPSSGTGPQVDNTLGTSSGTYLFSESSSPIIQGDEAILTTRKIDVSALSSPRLQFFYHMHGNAMGTLKVEVEDLTNASTTEIFSISGQQQMNQNDPFLPPSGVGLDLSSFTGSVIEVKFIAVRGSSFTSDIAIDDISIDEQPSRDVGIVDIEISNDPFFGSDEAVTVAVVNNGSDTQSSFDVSYVFNGETPVTESFTSSIASGDTLYYSFSTTLDLSEAIDFSIQAYTSLSGDLIADNDTTLENFRKAELITSLPYSESFENGAAEWYSQGAINSWELGAPDNTIIESASDGETAWVTNLTGTYLNNEESYVYSPYFDLSSLTNPAIQFDLIAASESNYDGTILEYTLDRGTTWNKLGDFGDPDNWYNEATVSAHNNTAAWDNNNSGWVTASRLMSEVMGESEVGFRFKFATDGSVTREGFAFDDLRILDLVPPQSLTASDISDSGFLLTWNSADLVDEYILEVSNDNFVSNLANYDEITISGNSFQVIGLTRTTTYQVRLKSKLTDNYVSETVELSGGVTTLLGTPIATSATNITTNSFTANWDVFSGAVSYNLEVSEDDFATNLASYDQVSVTSTSFDITGLEASTVYKYRLTADLGAQETGVSNVILVTTESLAPESPSNLTLTEDNGDVQLNWTDNSDDEDEFIIERKVGDESDFSLLETLSTDATTFTDEDVAINVTHSYRIYAKNVFGNSEYSNVEQIVVIPAVPEAPDNLIATLESNHILLTWSDNSDNETSFVIRRKLMGDTDFISVDTLAADVNSYEDIEIENNTTYYYHVIAINITSVSDLSNEITILTKAEVPTAIQGQNISSTSFVASWNDVGENVSYELEVSSDNFQNLLDNYASIQFDENNITVNGLDPATNYQYRVRSYNDAGLSDYSNTIVVTTLDVLPAAPSDLTAEYSNNQIVLDWIDNADNEDEYVIERKLGQNEFEVIATLDANQTTYSDELISEGEDISYKVMAVNSIGSSEYSNVALVPFEVTSNTAAELMRSFKIFPNPSKGNFELALSSEYRIKNIKVIDLSGRLIVSKDYGINNQNSIDKKEHYTLDITDQRPGIYLLYVETASNDLIIKKIIKN
ncbi:fibronectin type III domain-containing protein [Marivirga arenosa]|uniref:Fibronectin type III domain-containing protein n=1 Tax=Marivirga arenosa TaxID=3059076 RepID=A0AA51R8I0_9BACT|nr:fibronectin type III domain-containing protein [Marivirga sp. ABR2-2]WMN06651.1 fibronectin type III domain-containing protein [Marivirga sp. ABR2-2]